MPKGHTLIANILCYCYSLRCVWIFLQKEKEKSVRVWSKFCPSPYKINGNFERVEFGAE